MSAETIGIIVTVLMFVLMLLQVPVAISMFLPTVIGIFLLRDWYVLSNALEQIIFKQSFKFTFSVIPLFIWMGEILTASGVSNELYSTFRVWLGRLRGGLGMATIGASAIFAAASGSSVANTATIGGMAAKEMMKSNYNLTVAGGSIVAGGTLGLLIPPSTFMILYGMMTEQSVGKLLIAGIIPGIVLAILFMLTIYIVALFKPDWAPPGGRHSWKERFSSLKNVIWFLLLFVVVIGGMFVGFFGPTEAAGIGTLSALIIAALRGKVNWAFLKETALQTIKKSGFIYAMILSGFTLNYLLSISKLPIALSNSILEAGFTPFLTFLIIIVFYVILGMFLDSFAILVLTMPFLLPILTSQGFDLVWFGVVMCILVEMAQISPPNGINLMVLHGTVPELKMASLFKGGLMFLLPMLAMIFLLYLLPQIALFLPNRMISF